MKPNPNHRKLSWNIALLLSVDTLIQSGNLKYTFKIHKEHPKDALTLTVTEKSTGEVVLQEKCGSLRLAVLMVERYYNPEWVQ